MRLKLLAVVAAVLAATLSSAIAQQEPASHEVILSPGGQVQGSWVERELCSKDHDCELALMNSETDEVARLGNLLGSDFEYSGNGLEIRRAETAMEKAVRLKASNVE